MYEFSHNKYNQNIFSIRFKCVNIEMYQNRSNQLLMLSNVMLNMPLSY